MSINSEKYLRHEGRRMHHPVSLVILVCASLLPPEFFLERLLLLLALCGAAHRCLAPLLTLTVIHSC